MYWGPFSKTRGVSPVCLGFGSPELDCALDNWQWVIRWIAKTLRGSHLINLSFGTTAILKIDILKWNELYWNWFQIVNWVHVVFEKHVLKCGIVSLSSENPCLHYNITIFWNTSSSDQESPLGWLSLALVHLEISKHSGQRSKEAYVWEWRKEHADKSAGHKYTHTHTHTSRKIFCSNGDKNRLPSFIIRYVFISSFNNKGQMDKNCKLSVLKWENMVIHWLRLFWLSPWDRRSSLLICHKFPARLEFQNQEEKLSLRHTGSLQGYSWSCDYREHHFYFRQMSLLWALPIAIHGRGALYIGPTLQFSEISTHDTDIQSHLVPLAMSPSSLLHHFLLYPKCLLPHPHLPF